MNEVRIHGYARVSSKEQNEARQIKAFKEFGISDRDIYLDKESGKDFNRTEYKRLINCIRKGDLLVIQSIDRLGRNYNEIMEQWRLITNDLEADIVVLDMPLLDTRRKGNSLDSKFVADLVLQILSYVAEKERNNIRARQRQGIEIALAKGAKFGRPKVKYPDNWNEVFYLWDKKEITSKQAMERMGLKRNSFYKLVGEYRKAS